ncbi:TonB-dependent receptor [Alistipes shahii]|uniref:SusC/RagA family TonB-linked outer membrane protein n=1 Tax=Alistipes shahii TaxID=328814 RepID=UPI00241DC70A|nr:TonB-dependent receptor [Alistipes shahii]
MTKFYLTLCCLLTAFAPAAAQQLTGVVTDNNGEPLFGAVAALKGKTAATTTGVRGEYALQGVDLRRDTLVFTYVGMKKLEVPVAGRTKVDVRLEVMNTAINEVVVIGYGTMRRADLTGAVSSVSSEEIVRTPVNNIAEAISGKLAGVQVLTTDGAPDAEVSMYVRGRNSITQSSSPLYIVDGFPVSSISDISPSDIQSIDVLKDASSTAIYGSRGANGVIMVTTKSARQNGVKVSFNAYAGLKYVTPMPDMLDPYEYALWQYEQSVYRNSVSSMYEPYFGVYEDMHLYKNYAGNDWKKIVFGRSATTQNYNVALTGKGDKMTYSASYTRQMDDAVMITSDFVRDNFTFKFQHKPSRKVTLDFQSRFSDTKISGSGANEQSGGRSSDPRMRYVMQYSPIPLKGLSAEGFDDDEFYKNSGLFTPTEYIRDNDRIQKRRNLALSGGFSWTIAKNLVFRSNLNLEFNWNENQRFFGITTYYARMNSVVKDHPAIELTNTDSRRISNYNTLSYDFKDLLPKKHRLNILVGQELNTSKSRTLTADIDGFPVTFSARQAFRFTTEGTAVSTNNFYATPDNLLSFFTRINYSYDDRYLVTGTLRADGSSKFQKSQPWGYFPSGAVAWRISEEPFLKETEWLSQLKLRASIGLAGNDNIPGGQTLAEYTSDNTQLLPFETSVSYWSQGKYMTNPDLVWETTVSRNVGLDFGFFNNRLNGNLDLYLNTTHDQLILFPIKGAGYTHQYRNMGSTQNKGIELALNAVLVDRRDYSMQFSFNIAMNRNKVLDLGGLDRIEAYSSWASTQIDYDFVVTPGQSLGQIWGYVSDGRYPASDFTWTGSSWQANEGVLDNSHIAGNGWGPGAVRFRDLGGDPDAISAGTDRTVLGCTLPKATGGFSLAGRIKGFDFNANFTYTLGNKILNVNKAEYTSTAGYRYQNLLTAMSSGNRWQSIDAAGQRITDPALLDEINRSTTMWTPMSACRYVSSYIVEDGSFLRLNSATIGYSLPEALLRKIRLTQLRIYVTGTNLFCWTGYSGFDPEVDTRRSTPLTPGVDYSPYPKTRGFIVGLNLTF